MLWRRATNQIIKGAERGFGTLARCNHDLFIRHRCAIARSKYARQIGGAFGIDFNLAKFAQIDRIFQKFGIGHQANLHKHAGQIQLLDFARLAVFFLQGADLAISAMYFCGGAIGMHGDIGQRVQFIDQDRIGFERGHEFDYIHMLDHASQINRRFHA